jgi:D-amino-acid dehydrogenase
MDMEAMFVASSMEMGLRSAGTAEFAGLDAAPDKRRGDAIARATRRMLPGLASEEPEIWMGHRPSFPDSLPCIGEMPSHPGLIAAFGHSHYGLGMAPMTGELAAELAMGRRPNTDLTPYRIDRFE